jgi:hypothetical protein
MNAAVWLGTTVFFTFGANPACFSPIMTNMFKADADAYYPNVVAQAVMAKYYVISMACAVIALLHFLAKWFYMGRPSRKFSGGLVISLFLLTLIASNVITPELTNLNKNRFTATQPAERQSAAKWFHILRAVETTFNFLMIGGLMVYTWRIANPSDTLRFVSPVKFRS